ncbi:hypothetical protein ABOZ73_07375 [Caulobacter sp. 73W]|uniref:STAS domain-containing protein n=1 Tax=Caulobacter sp. 73W TaxID=3161137 RepID=A0AB39KXA2_9CAUL
MRIVRDGTTLRLQGVCRVEDAEPVAAALQEGGIAEVDLSACEGLHGAVVQALLVFGAPLTGEALDPFTRAFVAPALAERTGHFSQAIEQAHRTPEESN